MEIAFVALIGATVAAPFLAFAWAAKPRTCTTCGAPVEPNPALMRAFMDE